MAFIKNEPKKCSIDECNNKHHGKGYCVTHYNQYILVETKVICSVDGCNSTIKGGARGMCSKHYIRFMKFGDTETVLRDRSIFARPKTITIDTKEIVYNTRLDWSMACKLHYGDKCSICGWNKVTCDANHIIPFSKGGLNTISNGEILCPNCHAEKHRQLPIEQRIPV